MSALVALAVPTAAVELVSDENGRVVERPAPPRLTSHHVTVVDVYGSLF